MSDSFGDALPEQFRFLVEQVEEYAIFLLGPDGRVASWNAGAEKIKGYSEAEILGEHFSIFYPEEEVRSGTPDGALEAAAREGQWIDKGWRLRKDGTRFWARVTITALQKEERLRGFAKVTRDMTERREHETELERKKHEAERARERARKEAALLRLMEEVATAANNSDTFEEALSRAVTAVCEHTGWPVGHVYWVRREQERALVSSGIWHIAPSDRFAEFRTVTDGANVAWGETLPGRIAEAGEPTWIRDVRADPDFVRTGRMDTPNVRGAFGIPVQVGEETVAVLDFFSDTAAPKDHQLLEAVASVGEQLSRVAEREEARRSLRESEALFRALTEQSLVGIGLFQNGVYEYVNPTFAQYFGYDQEELIGCSPEGLFHPKDWPTVKEKLRTRIRGDQNEAHYTARVG
jgi:PAS domain S-box-containing protein